MKGKMILVLDDVERCFDCPLLRIVEDPKHNGDLMAFCNDNDWRKPISHKFSAKDLMSKRADFCRLRPLPNDCLDSITGETE